MPKSFVKPVCVKVGLSSGYVQQVFVEAKLEDDRNNVLMKKLTITIP